MQPLVDALKAALLERSVLHADETPVAMLVPGKGKTHRAYICSYSSTAFDSLQAVVYDFAESRAAAHPKGFLDGWRGKLVCDDYSGYKGLFSEGVIEIGCLAHYPESRFIRSNRLQRSPLLRSDRAALRIKPPAVATKAVIQTAVPLVCRCMSCEYSGASVGHEHAQRKRCSRADLEREPLH